MKCIRYRWRRSTMFKSAKNGNYISSLVPLWIKTLDCLSARFLPVGSKPGSKKAQLVYKRLWRRFRHVISRKSEPKVSPSPCPKLLHSHFWIGKIQSSRTCIIMNKTDQIGIMNRAHLLERFEGLIKSESVSISSLLIVITT